MIPSAYRRRARSLATGAATLLLPALEAEPARAAGPDLAYGEYLANECVTCHQKSGHRDGIPSIVGWPRESFEAVLNAYRWKERENPTMQTIASRLTDEDIAALAAYFESLGPPKDSPAAAASGDKRSCSDEPAAGAARRSC